MIKWLSNDKIYDQLHGDLQSIIKGKVPDVIPTKQLLSRAVSPPLHKHPASPRGSPRISNSPIRTSVSNNKKHTNRTPSPAVSEPKKYENCSKSQQIIPQFYFPMGKPDPDHNKTDILNVKTLFSENSDSLDIKNFAEVTKLMNLPLYWKRPLFEASTSSQKCTFQQFSLLHENLQTYCHDEVAKFVRILSKGTRNYLIAEDFGNLIQDVIDTHPGMSFLDNAPEFHAR